VGEKTNHTTERKPGARGFTKRCRLSWLTNSSLVYEPKCGGGGDARSQLYTGAQINFRDLTSYSPMPGDLLIIQYSLIVTLKTSSAGLQFAQVWISCGGPRKESHRKVRGGHHPALPSR
jgi:hypothetical protein